jgi:hypothetical protein
VDGPPEPIPSEGSPAATGGGRTTHEPADGGTGRDVGSPGFSEEYRNWVAVSPFPFARVDMPTTMFGTAAIGTWTEGNPLVRPALERGTPSRSP